jgi:hypothetical protein
MYTALMNESAQWQLASIDPGGFGAEADRWRTVNANTDLITQLLADLQGRVLALEGEVAKLRAAKGVGNDTDASE